MNINSTTPYQSTPLYSKNKKTESKEQGFSIDETVSNTQDLKQNDSSNIWEELSSKYDVRKATFGDIKEIAQTLYEAGEISTHEQLSLTFDYERATNYLKKNAPIPISANFNMYETPSNSNGERDWIAEFEARKSKDFKYGNLIGYQTKTKILNVLQKLDTQ